MAASPAVTGDPRWAPRDLKASGLPPLRVNRGSSIRLAGRAGSFASRPTMGNAGERPDELSSGWPQVRKSEPLQRLPG